MFAETITFPVDTAKTRLQLQGQNCDQAWTRQRYRGMLNCLVTLVREEGIASVYQGISPALIRQAVYGTIKFGLYYSAKETLSNIVEKEECPVVNLACAIFAGGFQGCTNFFGKNVLRKNKYFYSTGNSNEFTEFPALIYK